MKKVLVVSSANMDMVMNIDKIPDPGQTVIDNGTYEYIPGGKGANSALAFSKLGSECVFLTRMGNDDNSKILLKLYADNGIDTSYIERDKDSLTGLASILVEKEGQNRIIVFPGANQKISKEQIDRALSDDIDALYMQFEINYDAIIYAAKKASEKGIPIFIDAGAIKDDFPFEKLPHIEVFSPNESETYTITKIYPKDQASIEKAAVALFNLISTEYVVIKLGSKGAYIFDGKEGFLSPSFDINVVDTTAAGDAFTAALTLRYLEKKDIFDSCKYANVVGALTVSKKGASTSIPSKEDIIDFLSKSN